MSPQRLILPAILTLSLIGNAALGLLYYSAKVDADVQRDSEAARRGERDFLLQLVPSMRPAVSQTDLAASIRSRYAGEQVNSDEKQVQWRLFHFWFDEHGRLVEAQWGS